MDTESLNFIMFSIWSIGIIGINIYLSHILETVHSTIKESLIHFFADLSISASAGLITYLLAKAVSMPDIFLVMIAATIGHLSARVAYKSILIDMSPWISDRKDARLNDSVLPPNVAYDRRAPDLSAREVRAERVDARRTHRTVTDPRIIQGDDEYPNMPSHNIHDIEGPNNVRYR